MNTVVNILNKMKKSELISICLIPIFGFVLATSILAQTTEFTYQGKLNDTGTQSATYDFEFYLCDTVNCDSVLDSNSRPGVAVSGGVFTVKLDFGAKFAGAVRFLEIRVKRPTESVFTTLLPRQKINYAPYSMFSTEALTAQNSLKLGGVAANQFVQTGDSRLSDARTPLPGSSSYIQNTNIAQPTVNFNIGGTGTANVFSATTGFNIGSERVLGNAGSANLFVGRLAGGANTGNTNTFVGDNAGRLNTTGSENTFVGSGVALNHTTGSNNVFLGSLAGAFNETGGGNIFIGKSAGNPNVPTQVNNSMAIGTNATVSASNSVAIGTNATVSTSNTIVLGTTAETTLILGKLVVGNPNLANPTKTFTAAFGVGLVADHLVFRQLGTILSSPSHVCFRSVSTDVGAGGYGLTNCTSALSSAENKIDVESFSGGLDVIKRLKPVAFKWKADGASDVGLNAEDVAAIEPSLVTRSTKGKIEDVKENSLNVLFINAFKEQQTQIETQAAQIEEQRKQLQLQRALIDDLRKLVCQTNAQAAACKVNK